MKRTAIILTKDLTRGAAANVAAILMGEAARALPDLYHATPLLDALGARHAAIQWSAVLLEAKSPAQLLNFLATAREQQPALFVVVFTATGQGFHNAFDAYAAAVGSKAIADLNPSGVLVSGDDAAVRALTKKFSVLK
jgi:hypothetical protein